METGTYVIVRSSPSGCWAGTLERLDGSTVELSNARRLWRWWAGEGVSLSGVASHGLKASKIDECRIAVSVERAIINDVCEVLQATQAARSSIEVQPARVA